MYKRAFAFLAIGIVVGALGVTTDRLRNSNTSRKVVVFAGSAATPVYNQAVPLFETKYNVKVELRLGGSGSLLSAMQIAKTGDVYIPGSPDYLLQAHKSGVVNLSAIEVKILVYLVPAIIVQKGNPRNITCLEDLSRLGVTVAIGDPASVCVGLYAKELLQLNGLWDFVSPNIVTYAQSCEATAALIPTKAVDAIIGWHVFKDWTPEKADIIWIAPNNIPKISYVAGAISIFAKDKVLAQSFLDFLASEDARRIWTRYGYSTTVEETKLLAPNAEIELLG